MTAVRTLALIVMLSLASALVGTADGAFAVAKEPELLVLGPGQLGDSVPRASAIPQLVAYRSVVRCDDRGKGLNRKLELRARKGARALSISIDEYKGLSYNHGLYEINYGTTEGASADFRNGSRFYASTYPEPEQYSPLSGFVIVKKTRAGSFVSIRTVLFVHGTKEFVYVIGTLRCPAGL